MATCSCGKIIHRTPDAALKHRDWMRRKYKKDRQRFAVYPCARCRGYHVGKA